MNKIGENEFPAHFWSKVSMPAVGCWEWQGARTGGGGYGSIGRNGRTETAHRLAYELFYGPIPEGLLLRHECDNPGCVRPDHLIPGTHEDNARDKNERGRANSANGRKTHCKNGHELSGDNVRITTIGSRQCKICQKATQLKNQRDRRERARA